jgi:DNA-directed RNA polymerase
MSTSTILSPEETVAEARALLNRKVEELQRNNGINEPSNLNIATAAKVIRALTSSTESKRIQRDADRIIIREARWHNASLLSQYLDQTSAEFIRDQSKYGVYTLFELQKNKLVPLLVEATPKYVGMSTILSERLKQHAYGNSNPGERVTREFLQAHATEAEQAAYAIADRKSQREIRKLCMTRRRLWVRTAHTEDKFTADCLERAMIRLYHEQGYELWNDVLYTAGT